MHSPRPRSCARHPGKTCIWSAGLPAPLPGCTWSTPTIHFISFTNTRSVAVRPKRFFDIIGRQSRKSLERITTIARKRLELVPSAALILRKLIAIAAPQRVIFSAFGLREGYAYGLIPAWERQPDPLIAVCALIARSQSRFHLDGDRLQEWTAPLFPGQSAAARRIHRAACWLSDIAWSEHPDYRAEQAFTRSLRMPFAGISHAERVFLATALHTRYGGAADDPVKEPTRQLLDERAAAEVRTLGLALRLAYTLCGGTVIFCPRCGSAARATNWSSRSRRLITCFSAKRCSAASMPSPASLGAVAVLRRGRTRHAASG